MKITDIQIFTFDGTPDADGTIITNCPLYYTPLIVIGDYASRIGWVYNFIQNLNYSNEYYYVNIKGADASSGSFRGAFVGMCFTITPPSS